MEDNDKLIAQWQQKVRSDFGNDSSLYNYLFETMDNFYYRYLETSLDKNLKTEQLGPTLWGARSSESSMLEALKITQPIARQGIIELAKTVAKAQGPAVRYGLMVEVKNFTTDQGHLIITAEIDWGFPEYQRQSHQLIRQIDFHYHELGQFRKELALKLEEACEIFL